MNSVTLIGRVTKKPELNYTTNNTAVTKFSLAVDRPVSGEKKTDFIPITVFGKQAENTCRFVDKGKQIAVQGRIQTGSYKDKDGKTVYTTDVVADRVEFLGSNEKPVEEKRTPVVEDFLTDSFNTTYDGITF